MLSLQECSYLVLIKYVHSILEGQAEQCSDEVMVKAKHDIKYAYFTFARLIRPGVWIKAQNRLYNTLRIFPNLQKVFATFEQMLQYKERRPDAVKLRGVRRRVATTTRAANLQKPEAPPYKLYYHKQYYRTLVQATITTIRMETYETDIKPIIRYNNKSAYFSFMKPLHSGLSVITEYELVNNRYTPHNLEHVFTTMQEALNYSTN